jgi:hypothetical protein
VAPLTWQTGVIFWIGSATGAAAIFLAVERE